MFYETSSTAEQPSQRFIAIPATQTPFFSWNESPTGCDGLGEMTEIESEAGRTLQQEGQWQPKRIDPDRHLRLQSLRRRRIAHKATGPVTTETTTSSASSSNPAITIGCHSEYGYSTGPLSLSSPYSRASPTSIPPTLFGLFLLPPSSGVLSRDHSLRDRDSPSSHSTLPPTFSPLYVVVPPTETLEVASVLLSSMVATATGERVTLAPTPVPKVRRAPQENSLTSTTSVATSSIHVTTTSSTSASPGIGTSTSTSTSARSSNTPGSPTSASITDATAPISGATSSTATSSSTGPESLSTATSSPSSMVSDSTLASTAEIRLSADASVMSFTFTLSMSVTSTTSSSTFTDTSDSQNPTDNVSTAMPSTIVPVSSDSTSGLTPTFSMPNTIVPTSSPSTSSLPPSSPLPSSSSPPLSLPSSSSLSLSSALSPSPSLSSSSSLPLSSPSSVDTSFLSSSTQSASSSPLPLTSELMSQTTSPITTIMTITTTLVSETSSIDVNTPLSTSLMSSLTPTSLSSTDSSSSSTSSEQSFQSTEAPIPFVIDTSSRASISTSTITSTRFFTFTTIFTGPNGSPRTSTITSVYTTLIQTGVLSSDTALPGANSFARNTGAIIGIAIAGTFVLVVAAMFLFFVCHKRKERRWRPNASRNRLWPGIWWWGSDSEGRLGGGSIGGGSREGILRGAHGNNRGFTAGGASPNASMMAGEWRSPLEEVVEDDLGYDTRSRMMQQGTASVPVAFLNRSGSYTIDAALNQSTRLQAQKTGPEFHPSVGNTPAEPFALTQPQTQSPFNMIGPAPAASTENDIGEEKYHGGSTEASSTLYLAFASSSHGHTTAAHPHSPNLASYAYSTSSSHNHDMQSLPGSISNIGTARRPSTSFAPPSSFVFPRNVEPRSLMRTGSVSNDGRHDNGTGSETSSMRGFIGNLWAKGKGKRPEKKGKRSRSSGEVSDMLSEGSRGTMDSQVPTSRRRMSMPASFIQPAYPHHPHLPTFDFGPSTSGFSQGIPPGPSSLLNPPLPMPYPRTSTIYIEGQGYAYAYSSPEEQLAMGAGYFPLPTDMIMAPSTSQIPVPPPLVATDSSTMIPTEGLLNPHMLPPRGAGRRPDWSAEQISRPVSINSAVGSIFGVHNNSEEVSLRDHLDYSRPIAAVGAVQSRMRSTTTFGTLLDDDADRKPGDEGGTRNVVNNNDGENRGLDGSLDSVDGRSEGENRSSR